MTETAIQHPPLTPAVFHILLALADGEKHGYAIMQDVEAQTHGVAEAELEGALAQARQARHLRRRLSPVTLHHGVQFALTHHAVTVHVAGKRGGIRVKEKVGTIGCAVTVLGNHPAMVKSAGPQPPSDWRNGTKLEPVPRFPDAVRFP